VPTRHSLSPPELIELELLDCEVTARARRDPREVLGVDRLTVHYGRRVAIRDVSFNVHRGEIVAIVGHNGCGKTSTLRAVAGLTESDTGQIDIAGDAVVRYVPTERAVFAELTVRDNLLLGAGHVAAQISRARVGPTLDLFPELRGRLETHAGLLSGGEQRLVAFAIALMGSPSLLLVDEPTQFLGPTATQRVLAILRRLGDDEGISVLMAETNVAAVAKIADRAYVFANGAVLSEHSGKALREGGPRSWWNLVSGARTASG
jgi:branched-chain amino acid transport system ATP-binding protein